MKSEKRPVDEPRRVVVRHGGQIEAHGGIQVEKLLDNIDAGRATIGFAIYAAGSSTGAEAVTKPGMEFLMLLEGSIVAEVDGTDYAMNPGDSIWFPTTMPHRGLNHGTVAARALYVNYVPNSEGNS
jgi:uncharacterized cupin superfamily protein